MSLSDDLATANAALDAAIAKYGQSVLSSPFALVKYCIHLQLRPGGGFIALDASRYDVHRLPDGSVDLVPTAAWLRDDSLLAIPADGQRVQVLPNGTIRLRPEQPANAAPQSPESGSTSP